MQNTVILNSQEASCTEMLCHFLDQSNDHGAAILNLVERYINHFNQRYANLDYHERQDIKQDVAINLLSQGHRVRDNCPKAWVYTVVRNQCINHVRKQSKHFPCTSTLDYSEPECNETGQMPALDEGRNIRLLHQMDCLQNVFDQIEIQKTGKADITLYTQYAFGLSYKEIAKRSERTVDAIGQRISVLKKRLKQLIEECC